MLKFDVLKGFADAWKLVVHLFIEQSMAEMLTLWR